MKEQYKSYNGVGKSGQSARLMTLLMPSTPVTSDFVTLFLGSVGHLETVRSNRAPVILLIGTVAEQSNALACKARPP